MKENEKLTMNIDYSHILHHHSEQNILAERIIEDFNQYFPSCSYIHSFRFYEPIRLGLCKFMLKYHYEFAKERYFQIGFYNMPATNKIRELRTINHGKLMAIYGTVTRTTEVKPELLSGSFRCLECQSIISKVE